MFFPGLDSNFNRRICDPTRFSIAGIADEPWQTCLRSDHGAPTAHDILAVRPALSRRAQGQVLLVPRAVSLHGFRAAYLSREPAAYRSLPSGAGRQALSSWHPGLGRSQHPGQGEYHARLAHLCRLRAAGDQHRPAPLSRRALWHRSFRHGLCAGCHDDRPLPFGVPLGAVHGDQSSGETSYVARSSRQHPPRSFTSATASCTMSTCWISCPSRRGPST